MINLINGSNILEFNEPEDDTNAFSKTGALTIKSSSGSSGGLAAAFGIRREDSLGSDEFPHDSSCGDSHHHGNSGESSSDEGLEEIHETSHISVTLKKNDTGDNYKKEPEDIEKNPNIDKKGEIDKKKTQSKKSKELRLTTAKVNEIEVLKNSVSDWIDSVHNSHPMEQRLAEDNEKEAAIKPEYLPKHKHAKSPQNEHHSYPSAPSADESQNSGEGQNVNGQEHGLNPVPVENKPSHIEPKHFSGAELIEQVANNLMIYDPRPAKEFFQQSPVIADSAIISVADHSVASVSALNILNTATDGYNTQLVPNPHTAGLPVGHHSNPSVMVPGPPGFSQPINPFNMYPHQGPPTQAMFPTVAPQLTPTAMMIPGHGEVQKEEAPSTNTLFIEKMVSYRKFCLCMNAVSSCEGDDGVLILYMVASLDYGLVDSNKCIVDDF